MAVAEQLGIDGIHGGVIQRATDELIQKLHGRTPFRRSGNRLNLHVLVVDYLAVAVLVHPNVGAAGADEVDYSTVQQIDLIHSEPLSAGV